MIKKLGICFLVAIGTFVFFFSLIGIFSRFGAVSYMMRTILSVVIGLIAFVSAIMVIIGYSRTAYKIRQGLRWNAVYFIFTWILSVILFYSIKETLIFDNRDGMLHMIGMEWTIYAISIALFLVWSKQMTEYLERHKPKYFEMRSIYEKATFDLREEIYNMQAQSIYVALYMFMINSFVIIVVTGMALLTPGSESKLYIQAIVIFSFYLCTNTLLHLINGIYKSAIEKKKSIIKRCDLTEEEYTDKTNAMVRIMEICKIMKDLESNGISEKERRNTYEMIRREIYGGGK